MCDFWDRDAFDLDECEEQSVEDAEARIDAQFPGEWDDGEQGNAW